MMMMTQCTAPDLDGQSAYLVTGRDPGSGIPKMQASKLETQTRDMRHFWLPFWLFGLFAQPLQNRNLEPQIGESRIENRENGPWSGADNSRLHQPQVQEDDQVNFDDYGYGAFGYQWSLDFLVFFFVALKTTGIWQWAMGNRQLTTGNWLPSLIDMAKWPSMLQVAGWQATAEEEWGET